ncbi:MAG TPA: 2Fe-2S iron-sulfur cluster-binding protein, partial [Burkholderiaceae bacterium]|nr:2Fe-2S iron-sulfur cluster-binding protein [Burkholderiaceae bacterium]
MKIELNARNRAHQFQSGSDERILLAGLRQAIGLPYECGSGTCGTCKARLISGEIERSWPEAPGTKFLKARDEFLMCQCTARSDCTLEVTNFVTPFDAATFVPQHRGGRITRIDTLTADVMRVIVAVDTPMDFDAGQFVLLRFPSVPGYRAWSMANYERGATELTFILKRKPGGAVSELLFTEACTGMAVELFGPLGSATFYPEIDRDILCIAGGSGIAGMMAILERADQARYFEQHRGNVFFGVRGPADTFLLQELAALAKRAGDALQVTIALSNEGVPEGLSAEYPQLSFDTGYVHEVAQRRMQGQYQNLRAYLAGPPPSVDASVRMLLMARVTTDNIRYDKF